MSGKEVPFRDGDWNCALCENHNFRSREFCNKCSEPKKLSDESLQRPGAEVRQGDWICMICDNRNFASRDSCHKCQAQKGVSDLKLRAPPSQVCCLLPLLLIESRSACFVCVRCALSGSGTCLGWSPPEGDLKCIQARCAF